jgi:hypothetical protein
MRLVVVTAIVLIVVALGALELLAARGSAHLDEFGAPPLERLAR